MFPIVVCFGFLGACVKGLTGFGQAIVVLVLWSLFNAYGVDVGSLKQILMCDSFSSFPTAIPFMVLTNVCKYGKIGLILPIAIIMNLVSPIGAWLVANLDKQILTIILAITLVITVTMLNVFPFIMAIVKAASKKFTNDEEIPLLENIENVEIDVSKSPRQQLLAQDKKIQLLEFTQIENNNISSSIDSTSQDNLEDTEMAFSGDLQMGDLQKLSSSPPTSDSDKENYFQESKISDQAGVTTILNKNIKNFVQLDTDDFQDDLSIIFNNDVSCLGNQFSKIQNLYQRTKNIIYYCTKIFYHLIIQNVTFQRDLKDDTVNLNFEFQPLDIEQYSNQQKSIFCCFNTAINEHLTITATAGWLNGLKYLFICSIFAGLMGSMFAIPDPPLIIMTQILDISKQNIRATQSSLGLLNPRPLFYIAFGLFRMQDMHVYIMYTMGTMLGLTLGSWASQRVSQVWFLRMLTLLVVLSAVTLICQALQILPNNA